MPLDEFALILKHMPKSSVMDCGIAHHYKVSEHNSGAVFAICGSQAKATAWRAEIAKKIAHHDKAAQWFYGTNTSTSSLTIFSVLGPAYLTIYSLFDEYKKRPSTPLDTSDLKRCLDLCDSLNWHDRMPEVAAAYPDSHWPALVARWSDLRTANPDQASSILSSIA